MHYRYLSPKIAAVALALCLGAPPLLAGPATKVVVLLPGQTLSPGGISGSPLPQSQREWFEVLVMAVDDSYDRDYSYSGPLVGLSTSETMPTAGQRFGTSISAIGAATMIPQGGGELRISLNGENYRDYLIGPATTGEEVCDAIETAIVDGNVGRDLALDCIFDAASSRYTMFMNDGRPIRRNLLGTYPENSLTIDPAHGLAPFLHLGVSEPPSSDPNDASEFGARRLVADPAVDLVFDRGFAAFSVAWNTLADLGPGETLTLDQGAAGLPVESTPFEIEAAQFKINSATVLGDGNGNITQVEVVFNQNVNPPGIGSQASNFTLEDTGTGSSLVGTSLTLETNDLQGYVASMIEVTFGTGLGKTDITDVEVRYTAPANPIQSDDTGQALASSALPNGNAFLIDEAPPVLISATALDTDANGGLDLLRLVFSEPIRFRGGHGVSVSGFGPVTETTPAPVPLPASLVVAIDGEAHVLQLEHPTNPAATEIAGGSDVADTITIAMRHNPLNRPAYSNFTCEFTNGRYVLRAGIPLRSVSVLPSPLSDDAAPLLRLGPVNGGIERLGSGDAVADVEDFIVLSQFDGQDLRRSLLEGLDASSLHISGNELQLDLTNVPNSGTATPSYVWKDNGDLAFIADRAPVPNRAVPANNVGLAIEPHPSGLIRIRDTDQAPDDGVLTKPPGPVELDATQTIPPLLPSNVPSDLSFEWTQIEGPVAVTIEDPDSDDTEAEMLRAGTYVFQLTVTVLDDGAPPAFNPWVHADGTLGKTITVVINPGPAANLVLLLPGESLRQGVVSHAEAIEGEDGIATPGVPYSVRAVCTDAHFNVVNCPTGASASLTTSDPADVEPASQPLAAAGATFTLQSATAGNFSVDDIVVGFFEMGDVARPYVIGSVWNGKGSKIPGSPGSIRLTWDPDPRPGVTWNVYAGALPLRDLDHDGLPDSGYGSCLTGQDPDPTDTTFDDLAVPPAGLGRFYVGTMVLDGQETSPGVTSAGLERVVAAPCP